MIEKQPLVSIIIPVFNGSNYLREAIDSALEQTYGNIEIIVINDGSTDNTEAIALSFGEKIRYIKKTNGGVSSALNLGIKEMKGEYFSWLSHDDKYSREKIAIQINALFKYKRKDLLVYCNSHQIDKDGKKLNDAKNNKYLLLNTINSWEKSLEALVKSGCFNGCSFLIPRIVFEESGSFDEELRFSQDFLMWSNIFLRHYSLLYIDNDCVMSRVHNGQLTQKGKEIFYSDSEKVAKILYDDLKKSSYSKQNFIYFYAKYFAKYNCKSATKLYKNSGLLSLFKRGVIFCMELYGSIRPFIRKLYLKIFRRIKTS